MWFTALSWEKIGRITTDGAVSEFLISETAQGRTIVTTNIAAGPDCALWFGFVTAVPDPPTVKGVFGSVGIGRITTDGVISKYLLPSPNSMPTFAIAAGPDGALWFAEDFPDKNSKIGRIGQIDENVKADLQTLHWERWVLYLEILASLAIIIPERLKRLHLH